MAESSFLPQFTLKKFGSYKEKNANGAYLMQLMELFLAAGNTSFANVLEGLPVEVEGAVRNLPGESAEVNFKRMYRMSITCCAADMQAIPIKLELQQELAEKWFHPEHTWLRVEGRVVFDRDAKGRRKVVIKVYKVEPAEVPPNELLHGSETGQSH